MPLRILALLLLLPLASCIDLLGADEDPSPGVTFGYLGDLTGVFRVPEGGPEVFLDREEGGFGLAVPDRSTPLEVGVIAVRLSEEGRRDRLGISISDLAPGTYPLRASCDDASGPCAAGVLLIAENLSPPSEGRLYLSFREGSVRLERATADRIRGTFRGTLVGTTWDDDRQREVEVRVLGGEFDVPLFGVDEMQRRTDPTHLSVGHRVAPDRATRSPHPSKRKG